MLHTVKLGRLSIPINQQESNILQTPQLRALHALVFYNPAAFTGVIAVEVAMSDNALAAAHAALYNNGTAVVLTAARVERHDVNGFLSLMIDSSLNEAAQRDVDVMAVFDIGDA